MAATGYALTATEINNVLDAIELGWAKRVTEANYIHVDAYGENQFEYSFYHLDGRVFFLTYEFRNTITQYYEVAGENLEMFLDYYKLRTETLWQKMFG